MMAAKSAPLRFPSVKIICNMCRRPSSMRHQFLSVKVVPRILRNASIQGNFLELPNVILTVKDVKMNWQFGGSSQDISRPSVRFASEDPSTSRKWLSCCIFFCIFEHVVDTFLSIQKSLRSMRQVQGEHSPLSDKAKNSLGRKKGHAHEQNQSRKDTRTVCKKL